MAIRVYLAGKISGDRWRERIFPGPEWSSDMQLEAGHTAHPITKERRFFRVDSEARGPAVGHEFEPCPDDPACCRICLEQLSLPILPLYEP